MLSIYTHPFKSSSPCVEFLNNNSRQNAQYVVDENNSNHGKLEKGLNFKKNVFWGEAKVKYFWWSQYLFCKTKDSWKDVNQILPFFQLRHHYCHSLFPFCPPDLPLGPHNWWFWHTRLWRRRLVPRLLTRLPGGGLWPCLLQQLPARLPVKVEIGSDLIMESWSRPQREEDGRVAEAYDEVGNPNGGGHQHGSLCAADQTACSLCGGEVLNASLFDLNWKWNNLCFHPTPWLLCWSQDKEG